MKHLLALLCITLMVSCQRQQPTPVMSDSLIEKYISEYTSQRISVKEPIVVRFSKNLDNKPASTDNLLRMQPSVSGNTSWLDDQTLMFTPDAPLEYGKKYSVSIPMNNLISTAGKQDVVVFPVTTRVLEYSITLDPVPVYTGGTASISGTLRSSDWIIDSEIEEIIRVDRNEATVIWNHSPSGLVHQFTIDGIPRRNNDGEVNISWDASGSSEFSGEKSYQIAPTGRFIVEDIRPQSESNSIVIRFTDELNTTQNLMGLVKIDNYSGNLRFDKEGSILRIFPSGKLPDESTITLEQSIKSASGNTLAEKAIAIIRMDPVKPQLRLKGNGVVTPYEDAVIFPFEAIGLNAVDVEVLKIFDDNILQFLQNNKLDQQSYYLEPVGRIIHQQKVLLADLTDNPDYEKWTRYVLDLQNLTDVDPGALYIVRIGFRKQYTQYPCQEGVDEGPLEVKKEFESILRWNSDYDGYQYSHRNNPCYPVYYNESHFIQKSILASNIGLIVKGGKDDKYHIQVRNLKTLEPMSAIGVTFYDYQQQSLVSGNTDASGSIILETSRTPSFVIAKTNQEYAYLNIRDEYSNSLSDFDIGGSEKTKGIDGYLFGERGVWRPGDTMFLTFVLEDRNKRLPPDYPMSISIKDARGNQQFTEDFVRNQGDMYAFSIPTDPDDPTGNWRAVVTVGNQSFSQFLKVETVKPNRLQVNLDLPELLNISPSQSIPYSAEWLYGAPANGLKSRVEASLVAINTSFTGYSGFNFDDPSRRLETNTTLLTEETLSATGAGVIPFKKVENYQPPGKVRLKLKTRIFEKTGEFSEDNVSGLASFYDSYVGVKLPENSWGRKYLSRDDDSTIEFVVLSEAGKPVANRTIEVGLYEAEWTWWYNRSTSNIYRYDQTDHVKAIEKRSVTTDSEGKATWKPDNINGYRYMVRACDPVSGHCAGELFYTPYYNYESNDGAAAVLKINADKQSYQIGEKVALTIPTNPQSKVLLTVESGQGVMQEYWYEGKAGSITVEIPTDQSMAPNVYFHVSLIQKHNNEVSELPLRMYGVKSVEVVDPNTQLQPEISVSDVIRPKEDYTVTVEEKDGKEMYYTLAVVDEGLLNLTRYQTPKLWDHFYAKQALGVKTWDLYDMVLQGFGGSIDRYISIGGDSEVNVDPGDRKANRFDPVVTFLGPFHLDKGKKTTHELKMDNYMGAVRVMVVARNGLSYGSADKSVAVKNPVMVLPTVPRTLSPGETFWLPANVFVTEDNIKKVQVNLEVGPGLQPQGPLGQMLSFERIGDGIAAFSIKVEDDYQGPSYVTVQASGGGKSIDQKIAFQVSNPNPRVKEAITRTVAKGATIDIPYQAVGTPGTNEGMLEISTFPAMNLESRLDYLIRYPYGCIEQTTSSVFPQLYLEKIVELSAEEQSKVDNNIRSGINRLQNFQKASGGFSYWIGNHQISDWGTSYAGHFLLESKEKGFFVSSALLNSWISFQQNSARHWTNPNNHDYQELMQAYRLYTLAKAGQPEWGAMNSLRNQELSSTTMYTLAAAYAAGGKKEIASQLIAGTSYEVKDYHMRGYTYGSSLRDKSLVAEALLSSSFGEERFDLSSRMVEIAKDLGSQRWYSTQTSAFALLAVGKYLAAYPPGRLVGKWSTDGQADNKFDSELPVYTEKLMVTRDNPHTLTITNESDGVIYVTILLSGQADYGTQPAISRNLNMKVKYTDLEGKLLDVTSLPQGTDFIAEVNIVNPGTRAYNLEEMALSQVFPSGWEIQNERMSGTGTQDNSSYEYRDIRDDRVNTFFDLQKTKTFRTRLTATYAGEYYLPDLQSEAMYDHEVLSRIPGKWVTVIK